MSQKPKACLVKALIVLNKALSIVDIATLYQLYFETPRVLRRSLRSSVSSLQHRTQVMNATGSSEGTNDAATKMQLQKCSDYKNAVIKATMQ